MNEEQVMELTYLRARLSELEQEIAGGEPEIEDPRLPYVSVQIDRKVWLRCRVEVQWRERCRTEVEEWFGTNRLIRETK